MKHPPSLPLTEKPTCNMTTFIQTYAYFESWMVTVANFLYCYDVRGGSMTQK